MPDFSRRDLLGLATVTALAALKSKHGFAQSRADDLTPFSTATQMIAALHARRISAAELYEMHVERIDEFNPSLNAVIVRTFERGRREAAEADRRLAAREHAPLLGLPITLKESEQVAGLPQTAGMEALRSYQPDGDGLIATRMFGAGAVFLGKTNIPVGLGDFQANNPIYGRTNNPWNLERTPGGSTGGGAAAVAAGLTPLEIGSDIAGSIRVPAAFTGVYGHRPSENAVPRSGSMPRADLPNPSQIMGVQGPLARSGFDLELALDVIAGPDVGDDAAWKLELPPARRNRLRDYRVAILPWLPWVPVQPDIKARVAELADWLRAKGVDAREASPELDWEQHFGDYFRLLVAQTSGRQSAEQAAAAAATVRASGDPLANAVADGMTLSYGASSVLFERRAQLQRVWHSFFRDWDVLLTPASAQTAFPHRDDDPMQRTYVIDGHQISFLQLMFYPQIAIFCGLPATAFPAGLDGEGLPIGVQAVGPFLEDRTPLRFVQLLEREWRAFTPPPAYAV